MVEKMNLEILKKEFETIRLRYNLPDFARLNEDFDIERLQEKDTELLVREIRRVIVEKNMAYLRFIEMFMNPSQAPMFFLSLVKNLSSQETKFMEELYSRLGKYEIISLELDNEYSETKEAEFIKKFFNEWQGIKKEMSDFLKKLQESWDNKSVKRDKGYLG